MRTIIAGSRDLILLPRDRAFLRTLNITTVLCGAARGVDLSGKQWADLNNVPVEMYPAEWDLYGKSAGYRRNAEMASKADQLVAFWDGKSRGTKHMIDLARMHKLKVIIVERKS